MTNSSFFKFGCNSSATLIARAAEVKPFTRKDGSAWTAVKLSTSETYVSNNETKTSQQTVPVYVEGTLEVEAGDLISLQGEVSTAIVAQKSETNKYAVTQLVVKPVKFEVASHSVLEAFGGINKSEIIGRVGSIRKVTAGQRSGAVVSVAVSKSIKDKDGNYADNTDWIEATFWGKRSETLLAKVSKGDILLIKGKLNLRNAKVNGADKQLLGLMADDFNIIYKKPAVAASTAPAQATDASSDEDVPMF